MLWKLKNALLSYSLITVWWLILILQNVLIFFRFCIWTLKFTWESLWKEDVSECQVDIFYHLSSLTFLCFTWQTFCINLYYPGLSLAMKLQSHVVCIHCIAAFWVVDRLVDFWVFKMKKWISIGMHSDLRMWVLFWGVLMPVGWGQRSIVLNNWRFLHIVVTKWDSSGEHARVAHTKTRYSTANCTFNAWDRQACQCVVVLRRMKMTDYWWPRSFRTSLAYAPLSKTVKNGCLGKTIKQGNSNGSMHCWKLYWATCTLSAANGGHCHCHCLRHLTLNSEKSYSIISINCTQLTHVYQHHSLWCFITNDN